MKAYDQIEQIALQLFPNNDKMATKWILNTMYLFNKNKHALQTGGWIVPGGEYMKDFKFSKFNNGKNNGNRNRETINNFDWKGIV